MKQQVFASSCIYFFEGAHLLKSTSCALLELPTRKKNAVTRDLISLEVFVETYALKLWFPSSGIIFETI